jgi:uncharacterized repeat protein (TIGR04076 family)
MRRLHKCKITVLDRLLLEDIAREYSSDPNLTACDLYQNGQEFILDLTAGTKNSTLTDP